MNSPDVSNHRTTTARQILREPEQDTLESQANCKMSAQFWFIEGPSTRSLKSTSAKQPPRTGSIRSITGKPIYVLCFWVFRISIDEIPTSMDKRTQIAKLNYPQRFITAKSRHILRVLNIQERLQWTKKNGSPRSTSDSPTTARLFSTPVSTTSYHRPTRTSTPTTVWSLRYYTIIDNFGL